MNNMIETEINAELYLIKLKIKILSILHKYLINTPEPLLTFFYRILDLLKQKYKDPSDFNFLENIKCNIQNPKMEDMTQSFYSCNNENLLLELLNNIDYAVLNTI